MTIDATLIKDAGVLPDDASVPNPTVLTFGTHYRFQKAGVALEEHTHTDDNEHFTIVVAGSFTMTVAGVSRDVAAGDIINLGQEPHSFVAREDNSVVINVRKIGISDESVAAMQAQANAMIDAMVGKLAALKV